MDATDDSVVCHDNYLMCAKTELHHYFLLDSVAEFLIKF